MSNFIAEYAAQSGLTGTIQAAFTTAIQEKLSDANLTQKQRDEYLALSVKVANDGSKLIENLAAFIEMYTEHNGIKVPRNLSIGGKAISPITDYVVNGEDIAKIIVKTIVVGGATEAIALIGAAVVAAAGGSAFFIAAGTLAAGYYAGEFIGSAFDAEYDYMVGPSIVKDLVGGKDNTLSITSTTGSATNIFRHNWGDLSSKAEWQIYTVNAQERYSYIRSTDTITTNQSYSEILKLDSAFSFLMGNKLVGQHPSVIASGENLGNVYSFLGMSASAIAQGGQKALYAMEKLIPMVFDIHDKGQYELYDASKYSAMYLKDRSQLFYHYVNPLHQPTNDTMYTDMTTNYHTLAIGGKQVIFGTEGGDTIDRTGSAEDHLYGRGGNDMIYGNGGTDYIEGGDGNDMIWGDSVTDSSIGGSDNLIGGSGNDIIVGGRGNDILTGDGEGIEGTFANRDMLYGGIGFDTYIANNYDFIQDDDGSGRVLFEGFKLSGGTKTITNTSGSCGAPGSHDETEYEGDGGIYKLSGGTLTFTKGSQTLTIKNFRNGNLGITLKEVTNNSGGGGGSCPPPPPPPNPVPVPNSPWNHGSPLVLDLNGDGISATFIHESSTYFDLDNDGMRERTGWVQTTDALLALDKNTDGIINNASELFGNHTTLKNGTKAANGFEALREYDENSDGVIDAKDNIYNALQLWQDSNSDGITDTGELHSHSFIMSNNQNYTNHIGAAQ